MLLEYNIIDYYLVSMINNYVYCIFKEFNLIDLNKNHLIIIYFL